MEEERVLVLKDEQGTEHEFVIVDIFAVEDDEYAVLLPLLDEEEADDEAIILKIGLDDKGEEVLYEIEDDREWEAVARIWHDLMEEETDQPH